MSCPKRMCLELPEGHEEDTADPDLINILNDDCLARVFQFLPLVDRFRITAVCKRWKKISDLAWETTKILKFSTLEPLWEAMDLQQLPPKSRTNEGIQRVLMKCGRYLESLCLEIEVDGRILDVLCRYCQNLMDLFILTCDYEGWRLSTFFPRLHCLYISGISTGETTVPGELFQALPLHTLTKLNLTIGQTGQRPLPREALPALQSFTQLSEINLRCFILDSDIMSAITQIFTLKCINLSKCTLNGELPRFTSLTNLEKLGLGRITQVTDSTLIEISKTCLELKALTFSSDSVTDRGLSCLGLLTKLVRLRIYGVKSITDGPLSTMHNLSVLVCGSCPGVRDDGIIALIKYAFNLRILGLQRTGVTQRVLNEANEITKKRTNNIKLHLLTSYILSRDWIADKRSPLLRVNED